MPTGDQCPDTGKTYELPKGTLCTDGTLTDEVARDVWRELHARIASRLYGKDPLSVRERELYETLTLWLTMRAKMAAIIVSDSA